MCCGSGIEVSRNQAAQARRRAAVTTGPKMSICCGGYGSSFTKRGYTILRGSEVAPRARAARSTRRSTCRRRCFRLEPAVAAPSPCPPRGRHLQTALEDVARELLEIRALLDRLPTQVMPGEVSARPVARRGRLTMIGPVGRDRPSRSVAQPGSASAWGAEGREFGSHRSDHLFRPLPPALRRSEH